jgi:hypothetical protein
MSGPRTMKIVDMIAAELRKVQIFWFGGCNTNQVRRNMGRKRRQNLSLETSTVVVNCKLTKNNETMCL